MWSIALKHLSKKFVKKERGRVSFWSCARTRPICFFLRSEEQHVASNHVSLMWSQGLIFVPTVNRTTSDRNGNGKTVWEKSTFDVQIRWKSLSNLLWRPFVPFSPRRYVFMTKFDLIGRAMSQGNNCLIFRNIMLATGPSAQPFIIMLFSFYNAI